MAAPSTDRRVAQVERWFEIPVIVAALLVIPVIVIEESASSAAWQDVGDILNWTIWAVFAAEVIAGLAVSRSRAAWLRGHVLELAVVLLTPPFLPSSLQAARLVRLLRLLRLARLAKIGQKLFSLQGVKAAAFLALLAALGGGAAFTAAEQGRHPGHLTTWDGVWWSLGTMSAVGSGDLFPATTLGRVIGIAVMVVGLGFVTILTAALAERFIRQRVHSELASAEEAVELRIDASQADVLLEVQTIMRRLEQLERRLLDRRATGSSRT